ncbi:MAG: flippase-like domain-containing protein [Prevotellaceae bacterium]|jgi:uncharacterized membrane protein YbhN (UPF0104 family)|nr:flippase-like domain-containing protein [Prevotellaceae bacterium]
MEKNQSRLTVSGIKSYKALFPILIGVGVVVFIFWGELYPKPSFRGGEAHEPVALSTGSLVAVRNGALCYSSDSILYANTKRLQRQVKAGDVLMCSGDSLLLTLRTDSVQAWCLVLRDARVSMGDELSVEGVKLRVYHAGDVLRSVDLSWRFWCFLLLALMLMAGRDAGYMLRLRLLSDRELSWRQSLRVIMLWEFTSAITPSAVGGTSVAVVYVNKEGMSVGRSSAIVMATSLLDEIYFVLMLPLLLLLVPFHQLFAVNSAIATGLLTFTLAGYFIKLVWVLLLLYGLFVNPGSLRWLIVKVFSLPLLRRWKAGAVKAGDDVVVSASELKHRPALFWLKSFAATFLSWTSRYWVVNVLFMAFFAVHDHLLIFARQLIMWVMMLVTPTPGGSGFAEFVFKQFLGDLIPVAGLTVIVALLWRFVTYYIYLFAGAIVVPGWIKNKFGKNRKDVS